MMTEIRNFDLKNTLECGQLFRYEKQGDFYYLVVRDRILRLRQEGNNLFFSGCSGKFLRHYFALDEDYEKIIRKLKKDRKIARAVEKYKGLRICRQDPWECLISYICSSAANIPKITSNVNNLAMSFGRKIQLGEYVSYSFPTKEEIKDFCTIKKCGCGFRSRYILETAGKIDEKWLKKLKKMSYVDAKKELAKLPGVGEKIADAVMLFSLGFGEAFPVDVWIKRAMEKEFFKGKKTKERRIREFAQERWGKLAGYAQQFLYHRARND